MKKAGMSMTRIIWYENNFVEFVHTIILYYLPKKKIRFENDSARPFFFTLNYHNF